MTDGAFLAVSPLVWDHTADSLPFKADCGHLAWITPEGAVTRARLGLETRCVDCVDPEIIGEAVMSPEIEAAMVKYMSPAEAARVVRLANNKAFQRRVFGKNLRR